MAIENAAGGMGEGELGAAPNGLNTLNIPDRRPLEPIAAKTYDVAAKRWVVNEDGQYVGTTPVLQWVHMQIAFVIQSARSNPALGNPASQYTHLTADHPDKVKKRIESRLARKVSAGELQIHSFDVEVRGNATLMGIDVSDLTTGIRTGRKEYRF